MWDLPVSAVLPQGDIQNECRIDDGEAPRVRTIGATLKFV
jgi:hypothetical protein